MPAAIITQTTISPNLTALSVANAIATAMQAAGFTLISTVNGATETRAFSYQVNALATKSTAYLKVDVIATTLTYALGDNYTIGTNTMTGSVVGGNFSITVSSALSLVAVQHAEMRFVYVANSSTFGAIGYVRPATKYAWWDENMHLYAFLPSTSNVARLLTLPLGFMPLAVTGYALTERLDAPPPSGGSQLIRSPFLIGSTCTKCVLGQFSNDIASVPANAQPVLTEFEAGSDRFTMLLLSASDSAALAVRV